MRLLASATVLALLLAGCAGNPPAPGEDEPEADFGGVEATDTTGVIRGIVIDEAIRPIAGVLVNLTTGQANKTTGDDGAFAFDGLEPGTYFLTASKFGFESIQTSVDVVAGEDEPAIVKVQLVSIPSQQPYLDTISRSGFISFGASIGITSVGTTINPDLAEQLGDESIWHVDFDQTPWWAQGELVWQHSQPAGGMLIWEMVQGGTNNFRGYRETAESPALAYWNGTVLARETENVTDQGIDYRFFGGPHPLLAPGAGIVPERPSGHPACTTFPTIVLGDRSLCSFGYGLTFQQKAEAYIHNFYNYAPPEGWRFTADGAPEVPPS